MSLVRKKFYTPARKSQEKHLKQFLDDIFYPVGWDQWGLLPKVFTSFRETVASMWSDEKSFYIELEVPGMNEKDLEISLENRTLAITGKNSLAIKKDQNYIIYEGRLEEFVRTFVLPSDVDVDNVKATVSNGLLSIELPKVVKFSSVKKIKIL